MIQEQIFLPILVLVSLTFLVLLQIPYRRFKAVFEGKASSKDFELGESEEVPNYVVLPNRNYMNLLELPVLFYTACVLYYLIGQVDGITLFLSWFYVLLRLIHSVVHLTYNKVMHRLIVFAMSNVILLCMWVLLASSILKLIK